jgi:hypothetical protein
MTTESIEYEIGLYPRGPNSCEWKVWPKGGGVAKAMGVAKSRFDAESAAQKAKARLEARKA